MALVGNVQLVAGGAEKKSAIFTMLEKEGIEIHANPDLYYQSYKRYGIDQARELRERASRRAIGTRRVFVIEAAAITHDAQNALLKTIEEPSDDALFIFVIPSPETLLPTVRSRAQTLRLEGEEEIGKIDVDRFLASPPSKRLDMLKVVLEKDEDELRDIGGIITFLSLLERTVGNMRRGSDMREALDAIYRARRHIADKGALVKPLLEQVALLVPSGRV